MICEMERAAGFYGLESISDQDVLDDAAEEYEDSPELRDLCARAAQRVAHKWNSTGDINSAARDWALDLVREWAAERGLSGLPNDEESAAIAQARA